MSKIIIINSLILSLGIFIGRLSGYIREIIIASNYGATHSADTIILMLTIPDLLNNLLSSGAVVGILIPLLNSHTEAIEEILTEFTKKLFFITLMFYILVVTIIFFIYDFYLFGLLSISLLSIFPNIFTFVISGYLQFSKRFKKLSLNTLIFNIVIILFLLLHETYSTFSLGIILASILRMVWIYSDLKYTNISYKSFFKKTHKHLLKYRILLFMILANGLMFINPMIDKIFASFLEEGSVAILSYAEKIYLLPASVFLTTYAVAMFPDLSKMAIEGDTTKVNALLKKAIGLNIIISIFVGLIIYLFNIEIVNLFFGIAKFGTDTIFNISIVLNAYILALIAAGTNSILLNLIFAHKWYNSLIYFSLFMLIGKIILNTLIIKLHGTIEFVAYGTSLMSILSIIYLILIYTFKRKIVK